MKATVSIDDALYRKALSLLDPGVEGTELLSESLKLFVRVQSAKRLANMGGAAPDMQDVPRQGSTQMRPETR